MWSGRSVGAERRPGAAYVENRGEQGVGRFGFADEVVGAGVQGAGRGFGATAENDDRDVGATAMETSQEAFASVAGVACRATPSRAEADPASTASTMDNQDVGLGGFTDDLDIRLLFQKESHSGTQPGLIVRQ